jgi:CrcB protein
VSGVLLWAGVGALGGAGALLRFAVDLAVSRRAGGRVGSFPAGTLAVNVSGAVVLGLFSGLALSGDALLLAGTALLGSYTTFSTWMFETHRLAEDGGGAAALTNLVLSLVLGVGAALLGRWIGGG